MHKSRIALTMGMLLVQCTVARAQAVSGQLEGWVVAEDGSAISGAVVSTHAPGFRERSVVSDARGHFSFLALPPANYDVDITFIGRKPVHLVAQPVHIGGTTALGRIVAEVEPIRLESLTALSTRPLVDPTTSQYGTVISRENFQYLPIERDYNAVAAFLPHVTNSVYGSDGLNFAGATGLENHYYIDGANTTDALTAHPNLALPYNFIKEVQVRVGGYEAEYRGALGGVMNVVTQSGSNDLHGEVFGFFAGDRFGPRPMATLREASKGNYSQYDVGASISGPIKRDRMWFFASWNPAFETQDIALLQHGTVTSRQTSQRFAAKLTWQPAHDTRFEFNAFGNPTVEPNAVGTAWDIGIPPTQLPKGDPMRAYFKTGATAFSGRMTQFLTPRLLMEAGAHHNSTVYVRHARSGDSGALLFQDAFTTPGEVSWTGGYPEDFDSRDGRTAGDVRLTMSTDAHTWKLGADLERTYAGGRQRVSRLTHKADDSWEYVRFTVDGDPVVDRALGAFAQDSWAPSERWRINYGVRWGSERVYASDGSLAAKVKTSLSPRVGLTYQPGKRDHDKFSASFGRYYEQIPVYAPESVYTVGSEWVWEEYDHDPRLDAGWPPAVQAGTPTSRDVVELRGLYFDEWTLGYERLFGRTTKGSIRVVRRALGMALEDGANHDFNFAWGNPGYGDLSFFPKATRKYTALELSAEHSLSNRAYVLTSYVLSRNYGNYSGFFGSDYGYDGPNYNSNFDQPEMVSTGLLPNDRTHIFKASGWYRVARVPVTLGASFLWQSGTPLSELGGTQVGDIWHGFVNQRGTAGRTPAVRDLNLRAAYRLPAVARNSSLLIDLFHVASSQTPLLYDQLHYRSLDANGNQTDENPDYRTVRVRQATMAGRVGLEIRF